MNDNAILALRVNELFHDSEGKAYQQKHADIFTGEIMRWKNAAQSAFKNYQSPFAIMDIGTGTGFVPLAVAEFLSTDETFICSDISQNMLDIAKQNITAQGSKCRFEYLKINGIDLPHPSEKIAVVTMNSVVHHIPDLPLYFKQVDQLLEPGGRIMIGHEPNKAFYRNPFLFNLSRFLLALSSGRQFMIATARITRINKLFGRSKSTNDASVNEINRVLKNEKLISVDLSKDEINKLIDYHSPTGGAKPDLNKGIDTKDLTGRYLPGYRLEHLETYNFLGKMSERNALTKRLNRFLSLRLKQKGAHFFAILIKNGYAD
jgi:2-polyprenyl-3-methyl-5-hydroxy-6-metoxy-1,4-benzoquinol methylase